VTAVPAMIASSSGARDSRATTTAASPSRRVPSSSVHRGPAALLTWSGVSGLLDADRVEALLRVAGADPDSAARTVRTARRLRGALLHLLDAAVDGEAPTREDLTVVHRCLLDAWRRTRFAPVLPLRPELDGRALTTASVVTASGAHWMKPSCARETGASGASGWALQSSSVTA